MSAHSGVKLFGETDMLFSMDSKSPKSRQTDLNILSDWVDAWTVGSTGGSSGMSANGDGNSRILDTNPYGAVTTIWDVSNQDATSNADGGWNSSLFPIDNTKMYRYSVWIRRKTIGNGSTYFGMRGYSPTTHSGVTRRDNGTANQTNPYFWSGGWSGAGTWKLLVAHVWPYGSGTGSNHPESGFYDVNGNRIGNISRDYVWQAETTRALHRSYLYYSTNTSTNQQFWNPRVEIVDVPNVQTITRRTAPPVQRIIKEGIGGRWNIRNKATETAGAVGLRSVKRTSNGFEFGADNNDKSIQVPLAGNFNKLEGTISCWAYPTGYAGSNGIFVNRDNSSTNSVDWLWLGFWSSGSLFYFRLGNGSACCNNDLTFSSASSAVPVNTWTNITASWKSGGTSNIYINGVLKTSRSISTIPNTNPSTYGRIGLGHSSGTTGSWNGKIDQFMIYQKQLNASQILRNYQATRSRYV